MALFIANNGQLQTVKGLYKGLGRNLLLPSGINYGSYVIQDETFMGNRVVKLTYDWETVNFTVSNINPDTDYTFSIYTRIQGGSPGYIPYFIFEIDEYDSDNVKKAIYHLRQDVQTNFIAKTNYFKRFSYSFRVSSTAVKVSIKFGNHGWNNSSIICYASTPKVEEGTVATEWVPAQGTNTPY